MDHDARGPLHGEGIAPGSAGAAAGSAGVGVGGSGGPPTSSGHGGPHALGIGNNRSLKHIRFCPIIFRLYMTIRYFSRFTLIICTF